MANCGSSAGANPTNDAIVAVGHTHTLSAPAPSLSCQQSDTFHLRLFASRDTTSTNIPVNVSAVSSEIALPHGHWLYRNHLLGVMN